jgi:NADPH-dependent 2,4-dienoyl-CoA reductase/sulfur reductase-like enzyme
VAELLLRTVLDRICARQTVGPQDALRSYSPLEARGLRRIEGRVRGVDPARRIVETEDEDIEYSVLVLATGIELRPEAVAGLAEAGAMNLSLYDRGSLQGLRQALESFDMGAHPCLGARRGAQVPAGTV